MSYVMQVVGLFLIGTSLSGAWHAGFTQLTCQRSNTATVACTATESRLMGLVPRRSVSLSPLRGVFVEQQMATDDEGKPYALYRLSVDGENGEEFIFIKPSRDHIYIKAIADQLTQFSQNPNRQTLTLKERDWLPILVPLFFCQPGCCCCSTPLLCAALIAPGAPLQSSAIAL